MRCTNLIPVQLLTYIYFWYRSQLSADHVLNQQSAYLLCVYKQTHLLKINMLKLWKLIHIFVFTCSMATFVESIPKHIIIKHIIYPVKMTLCL